MYAQLAENQYVAMPGAQALYVQNADEPVFRRPAEGEPFTLDTAFRGQGKQDLFVKNVDGALVGGASLKASDFLGIAEAYRSF